MGKQRKVLVLGLDGMEPATTKRLVEAGKMPNVKKLIDLGAARNDLELLGAMPTITPAQWTTLACGCYPAVHGITDFWNQAPDAIDTVIYGLDSQLCQAEQLWNVTAEAGKKTLVWHWPGSSWPPSSENENLYVVDGTQPASVNYSIANIDIEKYISASIGTAENRFISHRGNQNAGDAAETCVIDRLDLDNKHDKYADYKVDPNNRQEWLLNRYKMKRIRNVNFHSKVNTGGNLSKVPFDQIESKISTPNNWKIPIPQDALEFTIYMASGQIARPCLILKHDGIYDKVAVYKDKAEDTPLCILGKDEIITDVVDELIENGENTAISRWYSLLELSEDGSCVRMWMSTAFKVDCDDRWHPKAIYQDVIKNCGYVPPFTQMGGTSLEFAQKLLTPVWRLNALWQSRAIQHLIKQKNLEVVFSHHHFIDHSAHQFWNYALQKSGAASEIQYQAQIDKTYEVADEYIGSFLHLLDEGWTILLVSDHGEQIHKKSVARLGTAGGVSAGVMKELGWTVMKKDADGNDTTEIDFEKTKAVAIRTSYIWINLKGRDKQGIVEPADKYDIEEQIIDDLYHYRDANGDRIVGLALHNKDAKVIGLDGPYTGDIIYMNREHHVPEHGYGLSTYQGYYGTTASPIFAAAGKGILHDDHVNRVIRQVDVAPTIAVLLGIRMPRNCEGAPVYQILEDYNE